MSVSAYGPGNGFYIIWVYQASTGQWTRLTDWIAENMYGVTLPDLSRYGWVAFYAQYAHFVNGAWDTDKGEWVPASGYQSDGGYYCSF